MRKLLVNCLIALYAVCCAMPATAERNFPENARRGEMKAFQYPYMKISDKVSQKTFHMSAGSRIFNEQNFIVMPASLQKQTAQIIFTTAIGGELSQVWLLTADEAKKYPLKSIPPPAGNSHK